MAVTYEPCPGCGSLDIRSEPSPCRCHRDPSCWSYPVCNSCGFTLGSRSANSDGTAWVDFTTTPITRHTWNPSGK